MIEFTSVLSLFDRSLTLFDKLFRKRAFRNLQKKILLLEVRKLLAHFEVLNDLNSRLASPDLLEWLSQLEIQQIESVILNSEGFQLDDDSLDSATVGKFSDIWSLAASVVVRIDLLNKLARHCSVKKRKNNEFRNIDFGIRIRNIKALLILLISKLSPDKATPKIL